ncbi:MAG: exodeoxyribonuclease III [Elusimicrobiota bacterium]|nr:exodeoxyribonuclease III [Elusimicrobiota bacterium]
MAELKIISWNVNGIRAVVRKGFLSWLDEEKPDILCLQEIKASENQLTEDIRKPPGYNVIWNPALRPGYSGTAIFSRLKLTKTEKKLGVKEYDDEGRTIIADFGGFMLINGYYPNGRSDLSRVSFKLRYYDEVIKKASKLVEGGRNVVLTGDFNTAHREIDLARPAQNVNNTGFLPEERAKMDELIEAGFSDTYRNFHSEPGNYSWWSYRGGARERNVGWRLDYFFVNKSFMKVVEDSYMLPLVKGSDHCPVVITLKI